MNIHPTAIISKRAQLAEDVEAGPHVLIEEDVEIGRGTKIYSHAHILKATTIGDDCQVHIGAVLGGSPQIRQSQETPGRLIIGQRNIFREYATVHRSKSEQGATTIGNDNYLMAFSHIAHDCSLGNHITICNGALIAGHTLIEDYAFISGNVTVHQFCRIGKHSMIGGLARVAKDVPPYMLLKGDSCVWAINSVGLKRANFSFQTRSQIKAAFKLLYKSGLNVRQATEQLQQLQRETHSPEIEHLINFILHSQRGICTYKRLKLWEKIRLSQPIITIKNLKCSKRQRFF